MIGRVYLIEGDGDVRDLLRVAPRERLACLWNVKLGILLHSSSLWGTEMAEVFPLEMKAFLFVHQRCLFLTWKRLTSHFGLDVIWKKAQLATLRDKGMSFLTLFNYMDISNSTPIRITILAICHAKKCWRQFTCMVNVPALRE